MIEALNKLNPEAIYKLTKVTTINPDSRVMQENDEVVGQAWLTLGNRLVIGPLMTSVIVEAYEHNGNFQIITKNSGYVLEKI